MEHAEHNHDRAPNSLPDLTFGAAIIVLIFNLSVLMAFFLLQAVAPPRLAMSELQIRDPAVTDIQKTLTTTPKENQKPLPTPPTIDRG
jgi:hypothetical protein